jgi:uncharacterized protein YmfQ (DUF2313 family)
MGDDRHVRRTGDDYGTALLGLLPQGLAWPTSLAGNLSKIVSPKIIKGIAQIFGYVDGRAADLLEVETDPRQTTELLPEWERAFGLPDNCIPLPPSDETTRRLNLVSKMTMLGDQSRAFFVARGVDVGEMVEIREFAPYLCGVSRVGDTRRVSVENSDPVNFRWQLGPPEIRFYWTVKILALLPSFKGADLSCLLRRWKPAHTDVLFDYSVVGADMLDFSEPIWDSIYMALL